MKLRNLAERALLGAAGLRSCCGARATLVALGVVAALGAAGCATVRPEQRAVLADPTMRFEGEPGEKAAREHVLQNRESSYGGGSVRGGGCGCN